MSDYHILSIDSKYVGKCDCTRDYKCYSFYIPLKKILPFRYCCTHGVYNESDDNFSIKDLVGCYHQCIYSYEDNIYYFLDKYSGRSNSNLDYALQNPREFPKCGIFKLINLNNTYETYFKKENLKEEDISEEVRELFKSQLKSMVNFLAKIHTRDKLCATKIKD